MTVPGHGRAHSSDEKDVGYCLRGACPRRMGDHWTTDACQSPPENGDFRSVPGASKLHVEIQQNGLKHIASAARTLHAMALTSSPV
ncbi:hypothetical protein HGRIS_014071 [Hohenbuehelia grisea]|uniref:Uncharacterized protein n=1 Tax=Hohenbuehelia grisea TaxID=104357 RepID=A0ABR3JT86_9AGAR